MLKAFKYRLVHTTELVNENMKSSQTILVERDILIAQLVALSVLLTAPIADLVTLSRAVANGSSEAFAQLQSIIETSLPPGLRAYLAEKGMLKDIVYLVVAIFLAAILLPPALTQIFTANTSGWSPAVTPVFEVLIPVVALIAVALYFFYELR